MIFSKVSRNGEDNAYWINISFKLLYLFVPVVGRFDSILIKYFALKMYK